MPRFGCDLRLSRSNEIVGMTDADRPQLESLWRISKARESKRDSKSPEPQGYSHRGSRVDGIAVPIGTAH